MRQVIRAATTPTNRRVKVDRSCASWSRHRTHNAFILPRRKQSRPAAGAGDPLSHQRIGWRLRTPRM